MITVVDKKKEGNTLWVTVQAKTIKELLSSKARKLAYEVRGEMGFESAGIEASGGPFAVSEDEPEKDFPRAHLQELSQKGKLIYRRVYKLNRGLS